MSKHIQCSAATVGHLQYHPYQCTKLLNGPDHLELLCTDDVNMRLLDDHQTTALQPAVIQDLLLWQVAKGWQNPGNVQLADPGKDDS